MHAATTNDIISPETDIFRAMKENPNDKEVDYQQLTKFMTKLLAGLMKQEQVVQMIDSFSSEKGITSELSRFNLKDFTQLLNRLLDDLFDEMDTDKSGGVSKQEFYENLRLNYGWQARMAKKHIEKTFDNAIKMGDLDGDSTLDKQEIKLLLRKIALGEVDTSQLVSVPLMFKLHLP